MTTWRHGSITRLLPGIAVVVALVIAAGVGILVLELQEPSSGADDDPTVVVALATPTARPEPRGTITPTEVFLGEPPFEVLGPLEQSEAMTQENLDSVRHFVLNLDTRQIYLIMLDPLYRREDLEHFRFVGWQSDSTLLYQSDRRTYRVQLNGDVLLTNAVPTPTSTPTSRNAAFSADEAWVATREDGRFSGILVGPTGEEPRYRLINTWPPSWSPTENLLAFNGSICAGFDLFVFDPDSQSLRNLTPSLPAVWDYAWKPDGSALAIDIIPFPDLRRELGLVDVTTGTVETLVEINTFGELSPIQWSPSGENLLFLYISGRGACETAPPQPTTTLEFLDN